MGSAVGPFEGPPASTLVLVDSSVWMAHERVPDPELCRLLRAGLAAGPAEVIHEICLGCGARPLEIAADVRLLPQLPTPTEPMEARLHATDLRCRGIGIADARIILAALDSGARLYSKDRGMVGVAKRLGILHEP